MKKEWFVVCVVIGIVFCFAVLCLTLQHRPSEITQENQPASENIQDILLTKIAAEKGIAKENVRICFLIQTENANTLAVGAITRMGGALTFFYDNSSYSITSREVDYATATDEDFLAFSVVEGKISPWTGNEIVSSDFAKRDNRYVFAYYDGYSALLRRLTGGVASVYLDNEEIEWGPRLT